MPYRRTLAPRLFFALLAVVTFTLVAQTSSKRPLTHRDYDSWNTIVGEKLSDDGKWLVYTLVPQEGDGQLVLRNLETGAELKESIGSRPPANTAESEPGAEPGAGAGGPRAIPISFTADRKFVVFTTLPAKAETDAARKAKKRAEEMPKGALVIMPTAGGAPVRIPGVRSFQVAEENGQWLAYSKEPPPGRGEEAGKKKAAENDQKRGGGGATAANAPRREFGSELVLRNLSSGAERSFADALEYSLPKDGKELVYTVAGRNEENNGFFTAASDGGEPKKLLGGKGRYQRITWDDKQAQLALLSSRDDAASRQPKYKVYLWQRGSNSVDAVVATDSEGFRSGWSVSDRGAMSFSKNGERLFFSSAPARVEPRREEADPTEEKVVADLWHWKDDNVQPMQKVRVEQERNRTYRAVYHLKQKRVVQLADATMQDLNLNEDNQVGIGSDDREYRRMVEFDERHSDYYTVDVASGARTLVARRQRGFLSTSPDAKYAVSFTGRDWISIELGTGRRRNLTEAIGVAFYNEDHDSPSTRNGYGVAGWTKDGKHVLLYDRFDVWQVAADGSAARNLTAGYGRDQKLQFRYVRFGESGPDRGIDPAKPLLLRAENLDTRESGFWEQKLDASNAPRKLLMGAKAYGNPVKAKNADVVVLAATRFEEFGDLLITDSKFRNLQKVSKANPQKDQFNWGTAELVRFTNLDGVSLQAALYKPENFDPKKKYPMVVYIYERLSQGVHGWKAPAPNHSINIPLYVSNGYLVLTPDIAYTIGYPGQSAMKCVLPAIQAVANLGIVNESAIGIQGHSWGGYQIAYMVTQTNRFKAAAAGAPVANMTSAYDGIRWGTGLPRQFQYERTQSRIGGSLWQYPSRFLENSPLFHADRVKTPVLMLHNDGDDAVPWYQGIEYFLALRRLGKEAYLFNYNGEPHGLRKRANQKDYAMRTMQFFDHHLKGAPKPEWMERGIPYLEREQEKEKWKKVAEAVPTGGGAQ